MGQGGVERYQPACGGQQQRGDLTAAVRGERDLRAQEIHANAIERVQPCPLGQEQELLCGVRRTGTQLRLRGADGARRPEPGFRSQGGGTCEEGRRRGDASACPGSLRRRLELRGDRLVGPQRRPRQVPRAAVEVEVEGTAGHFRQNAVDLLLLQESGRAVDRRAQQGVPEPDQRADVDHPGCFRGNGRIGFDPEALRRAPQQHHVADRFGGSDQQQSLRRRRKRSDLPGEAPLDAVGRGSQVAGSEALHRFGPGEVARQFQQRQRIAPRLVDHAVTDPRFQLSSRRRIQQREGVEVVQPFQREFGQSGQSALTTRFTRGQHQADRLGEQTPSDEGQRLRGNLVEPLRVVHEAEQRLLGRRVGQQAENRETDQEPVRRWPRTQPERRGQSLALRTGKPLDAPEERGAQLVQPGERKLHLGLDACPANDAVVASTLREMVQEGGLADTGLAPQHQDGAAPGLHHGAQPVEHLALAPPPA